MILKLIIGRLLTIGLLMLNFCASCYFISFICFQNQNQYGESFSSRERKKYKQLLIFLLEFVKNPQSLYSNLVLTSNDNTNNIARYLPLIFNQDITTLSNSVNDSKIH